MKSVVRRIGQQLFTALSGKGIAVLVNHGIADEKVFYNLSWQLRKSSLLSHYVSREHVGRRYFNLDGVNQS